MRGVIKLHLKQLNVKNKSQGEIPFQLRKFNKIFVKTVEFSTMQPNKLQRVWGVSRP